MSSQPCMVPTSLHSCWPEINEKGTSHDEIQKKNKQAKFECCCCTYEKGTRQDEIQKRTSKQNLNGTVVPIYVCKSGTGCWWVMACGEEIAQGRRWLRQRGRPLHAVSRSLRRRRPASRSLMAGMDLCVGQIVCGVVIYIMFQEKVSFEIST